MFDTCTACKQPVADLGPCACCGESVCQSCRDEIGGLTHCPACAGLAREFINGGDRVPDLPRERQAQLFE